jgi:hypothetical protein
LDKDASVKLFEIKKINNPNGKGFDVRLATGVNLVNISLLSNESNKIGLIIYDLSGRTIDTRSWNISKGSTQVQVQLQKGVYILKFTSTNNEPVIHRIMIE